MKDNNYNNIQIEEIDNLILELQTTLNDNKTYLNKNEDDYNLYHHELLDRLHCICVMFEEIILNHNSDDIYSQDEKNSDLMYLSAIYQKIGNRI